MLDVSRRSSDKPGLVENRRGNIRNLGGFGGALHWFQALTNGPRIAILAHKGSLEDFSILGELPLSELIATPAPVHHPPARGFFRLLN
jgi:hypothetical protein